MSARKENKSSLPEKRSSVKDERQASLLGSNSNNWTTRSTRTKSEEQDAKFFLAAIVESSEDSIVTVDFNNVITSWNKSAEKLYGYSASEAIGKNLSLVTLPKNLKQILLNVDLIKNRQLVKKFETVRKNKDGQLMDLEIVLSPVKNDAGEVIGVSTIARDITERKRHELNLAFIADIKLDFAPLLTVQEVMDQVAERLVDYLQLSRCHFSIVDEEHDRTEVVHEYLAEKLPSILGIHRISDNFSEEGRQHFMAGKIAVMNDVSDKPLMRTEQMLKKFGFGSLIDIPHLENGKWKFLLTVGRAEVSKWRTDEVELLLLLASLIYTRIERAKAEEALKKNEARLAKELADTKQLQQFSNQVIHVDDDDNIYEPLLDTAMKLMRSDCASFQLYLPETESLALIAHKNFHPRSAEFWKTVAAGSGSVCGEALRTRSRIVVTDIEKEDFAKGESEIFRLSGIRAILSMPILSRSGNLIGMLNTQWKQPRNFSDTDFRFFDVLVRQAADLIERKQAEENLRQSEAKFRRLSESDLLGVAFFTTDGGIIEANDEFLHMLGAGREELQTKKIRWDEYTPEEWLPVTYKAVEEFKEKGKITPYEKQFRRKDGQLRWGLFGGVKLSDDSDKGVAMVIDITDRKEAEQRLQQFNQQLEKQVTERTKEIKEQAHFINHITQTVPDMISVMELPSRNFRFINKKTFVEQGFDPDVMVELSEEERSKLLIHEDDRLSLEKYFNRFSEARDGEFITVEYRAKNFLGQWLWFLARGVIFQRDNEGKVSQVLHVIQNITERKISEEKIRELNKSLFAMNKDLNVLNSELKNFNAIAANNYTETLRHVYINLETIVTTDARNLSNSSRANIRRAQAAVQKMKLLTNDINHYLELYDVEIKKELIDPKNVLIEIKEKMQKKIEDSNATINIDSLPKLAADPKLFSKLMTNIIDNSIKYKKPDLDPVIDIGYSLVAEMTSNPKPKENTAYSIVSVTDNGIGFDTSNGEKVFELFTQLDEGKHKGSGIGLAICKKIMEMHGGFIAAESEVDKGTTISCYFPS